MFCPACGTQNSNGTNVCTACGGLMAQPALNPSPEQPGFKAPPPPPLVSGTTAYGNVGAAVASAPAPMTALPMTVQPQKSMALFGRIAIVVVSLLALFFALAIPLPDLPDEAQRTGYRLGTLIAVIFVPFLVAYVVAGRKKHRKPNLFAGLFCGIALFFLLANTASSFGSLKIESTDQKVSRLMREAAGLQPVRKSFFSESKLDTKLRDLFKELFKTNQEYQQAINKLDIKQTAKLATPQSFANPASVTESLQVLHAGYDLDVIQEQRLQKIMDNFKHGLDDLPPSDREIFLHAFDAGLNKAMPLRRHAIATEKAWIDAMDDVYNYAQAQHSDFIVSNGQVAISDNNVREEFNRRVHVMNAARAEFVQAKGEFDSLQQANLNKLGISRQQTGLH